MTINCPYCQHEMSLKGARPGRFTPSCPQCKQKFSLMVPDDVEVTPVVKALPVGKASIAPEIAEALGIQPTKRDPAEAKAAVARVHAESPRPPAKPVASVKATVAAQAAPAHAHASKPSSMNVTAPPAPASAPVEAFAPSNVDVPRHTQARSLALTTSTEEPVDDEPAITGTLGGYELIQKLGHGGMGSVYLARQVSLDRNVALKVLRQNLTNDARFVSRFTKEAFAAAQLTHHNVVQIHDIGEQREKHFFSMEFVEGETLSGLVEREGKLDPEVAVGYVLQAARGLKFAHDHGMVHRDVKPENLLLNDQGIVKVADLGLVKRAQTNEAPIAAGQRPVEAAGGKPFQTMADYAMGTPAYMPPEQATDAAHVDVRADIYSLGCTLYDLVTGRPPFEGKTVEEVLTKHQREPIVPPDRLDKHITPALRAIVVKMTAKRREERYQTMDEVIKDLEEFLGLSSAGPFTPKEEHVRLLESAVERYNGGTWAKLRPKLILGFYALCALLVVAMALLKSDPTEKLQWSGAFVGLALLTTLSYIVLTGITQRTFVFRKLRQLVFGARFVDWIVWLIGLGLVGALLYAFDQHVGWLIVLIVSAGLAAAFHFTIDLMMSKDRAQPLLQTEAMLKKMRVKGLDEDSLRAFVCKYAGQNWEEFYESLFGYEAKLLARQRWGVGDRGKDRKKWAAWRDPLIAWIDHKQKTRKERKESRYLAKLEAKRLKSEGVNEKEAEKKAKRTAETMVEQATVFKETSAKRAAMTMAPGDAKGKATAFNLDSVKVVKPSWVVDEQGGGGSGSEEDGERKRESWLQRKYGGLGGLVVGKQVRFILGAILLGGFSMWLYQNKSVPVIEGAVNAAKSVKHTQSVLDGEIKYQDPEKATPEAKLIAPKKPLQIKLVPAFVTDLFSNYNCGVAGALLILSCVFAGTNLGWFIVPAGALMFAGHVIPGVQGAVPMLEKWTKPTGAGNVPVMFPITLAAALIAVLGLVFARK